MSKKNGFGKMLAGLGIGLGLGMLFAPKSGEETRKDLKKKASEAAQKIKDVDLEDVKEQLLHEFDNLKRELKDMDAEKAKKIAKEKGAMISKKAEDLMEMAKEKSMPMVEKTARDVKKKVAEILSDLSDKLED